MTKPANLTKTILHAVELVLGGLVLAFLALPFFAVKAAGVSSTQSGYDFLDFSVKNPPAEMAFSCVSVLLVVIAACLLIVSACLALLGDFGVISNETYAKVVKWMTVVAAALTLVTVILAAIASIVFRGYYVDTLLGGKVPSGVTISAGWAQIVLNVLCGLGAAGAACYTVVKKD